MQTPMLVALQDVGYCLLRAKNHHQSTRNTGQEHVSQSSNYFQLRPGHQHGTVFT